ncbi:glycerophosphodiester phosphodiesterase [Amphibacillus sp. MSJ-3]|uniref:glycerophosphodiester phosphodiesterase n=1 Tax=Amphibacillus sp. MSJ-3 TaxID=2841505 RepID=UPI001C0EE3DA|nr:glycerophosphodiester phosphodiesterase family protein [Amphibacillus sp. MSJ-3]MBU5595102.1 glycerophosphodiester phosphodiesterase [Amphibacillus sp. MSJ-3]
MLNKGINLLLVSSMLLAGSYIVGKSEIEPEPAIVDSPKVIAHRGANDRFNESTITAYKIAAKDDVDALEIDLRMTADGVLIAMHDETIDRTTNGRGSVSDYSLEEIKEFQTVGTFDQKRIIEEIPTLREIIETFKNTEHYYIETRLVNGELLMEEPLIEGLLEYDLISQNLVTIQSFSEESLTKIQALAPEVPLTLLFGKGKFDLKKAKTSDYPIIGIEASDITLRIVNELHRQGKEIHVFFNDRSTEREEQRRVYDLNVDGYFTNDIRFTQDLLKQDND